jgi:hypothetical protein
MKVAWAHHGPPRSTFVPVPPGPSLLDWYVLGWDGGRGEVVYACRPEDNDRDGEAHAFDGAAWNKLTSRPFGASTALMGGGYDATRKGFVVWSFDNDEHAVGVVVTGERTGELSTRGDDPVVGPLGKGGGSEKKGLFAFDDGREVWVCVTRAGVWQLDRDGVWNKKADTGPIPQTWNDKSGEGAYDPVGKRTAFLILSGDNRHVVLTWDGTELRSAPMKGLFGVTPFDAIMQITGHPTHGLVLHVGDGRLYALEGGGWEALPVGNSPPPARHYACLAYDPKRDIFVLGPGKPFGAPLIERNQVFFVLRINRWECQGLPAVTSRVIPAFSNPARVMHAGGAWYAVTSTLQTWRYDDEAWREIFDDERGRKLGWEAHELVDARGRLHAVRRGGAVFAWDGDRWSAVAQGSAAFKKRTEYAVASDGDGRIIVWGGDAKGRKLNDTLFLEGTKWRAAKKTSVQPADFKHGKKDGVFVDQAALWDSALGAVVRFGYEDVAVLGPDDTWTAHKPKGYKENIGPRIVEHFPVHDPETKETLIINLLGATTDGLREPQVLRFDLKECTPLATLRYPIELMPKKQHDPFACSAFAGTFSFDPRTRSVYGQVGKDSTDTYRLDLGELFAKAKSMAPRTLPKGDGATKPVARFYRVVRGELEIADKPRAGFVAPKELSIKALVELVGVESRRVVVSSTKGAPRSRLGGEPSGVTGKTWPKAHGKAMGFLFQIETGALLQKHAGIAVFCSLEGEATNAADDNAVVLLKAPDFQKTCPPPDGVLPLPARSLEIAAPKFEIDEDRATSLAQKDPDLGAAFERLHSDKGAQAADLSDKLGGLPAFLQEQLPMKNHKLVAQLDFDSISTSKTWPDAGLAGCVYVFVRNDEKGGVVFWQYT